MGQAELEKTDTTHCNYLRGRKDGIELGVAIVKGVMGITSDTSCSRNIKMVLNGRFGVELCLAERLLRDAIEAVQRPEPVDLIVTSVFGPSDPEGTPDRGH